MNQKDNDYSDVIDANDYTLGLAEHPDIPQSDAGIIRLIKNDFLVKNDNDFKVLDLGCGPGRLTKKVINDVSENVLVTGLDISEGFIKVANNIYSHKNIDYIQKYFLDYETNGVFDIIFMQGSFHHIGLEERDKWVIKIKSLLKQGGKIIIGDEYIPDYNTESERSFNIIGLYSYVIAYAVRNNYNSLAKIESMNLVDDLCYGTAGAGHSNNELIETIKEKSVEINETAYTNGVSSLEYKQKVNDLMLFVKNGAEKLSSEVQSHNRGDYKISIVKLLEFFEKEGFKTKSIFKYGPTDWLGGMGVICFEQ